ncbi:unnamed protein product [Medioppia subpectinata]|uniref:Ig-like domain-containing protein n=1 Tax=Medioppia subpectinata TaxID=1979941 RepID=A0A7R9LPS2_9ACAR|nr:unnamed protein product [Medioppia subpectinata]CAG2120644.1 unnamed protein product [Medioppia subpectinata]
MEEKPKETGPSKPPRIVDHLTSGSVSDGSPVTLKCTIKCQTKFDIMWLHNDKEIKSSPDFLYKTEGDNYLLEIPEIFPEDSGIYTCEAFNDAGEAFSSCTLDVNVPNEEPKGPGITVFPQSITTHEGSKITFNLETIRSAKTVEWVKDSKPLEESSGCQTSKASDNKFSLTIPSIRLADVGQYTARATDETGTSSATFSLNVMTEADL